MKHETIETNAGWLIVLTLIVISIGGLVEIVPLYFIDDTIEKVQVDGKDTIRPYTPLELRGRDIYQREGCYTCHSQMIRPFRDEDMRYGHYSLAAESQFDHPFQWGSKRTGPDLHRIGEKYPDAWHYNHMVDPESMSPGSIMPTYPWLIENDLDVESTPSKIRAMQSLGMPYPQGYDERATNDLIEQSLKITADHFLELL